MTTDPVHKIRFVKVRPWATETVTEYRVAVRERAAGSVVWYEYGRVRSVRTLVGRSCVTAWEWRELDDEWVGYAGSRGEAADRLVDLVRRSTEEAVR